jgi:hypothetical protein
MSDLDAVLVDRLGREVLPVERHQGVCPASHCRGEHMPVLGVAGHVGNEMLEVVDQRCGAERVPHRGYPAGGLLAADADLGQVPFDFVEDRL